MPPYRRRGYRYGQWHEGPDPLAPPYDVRKALDKLGDDVLGGMSPREALRNLLRQGSDRMRGLDDMMRRILQRAVEPTAVTHLPALLADAPHHVVQPAHPVAALAQQVTQRLAR